MPQLTPQKINAFQLIIEGRIRRIGATQLYEYPLHKKDNVHISNIDIIWFGIKSAYVFAIAYTLYTFIMLWSTSSLRHTFSRSHFLFNHWINLFLISMLGGLGCAYLQYVRLACRQDVQHQMDDFLATLQVKRLTYPEYPENQPRLQSSHDYSNLLKQLGEFQEISPPKELCCCISLDIPAHPVWIIDRLTGKQVGNVVYDLDYLHEWLKEKPHLPVPMTPFSDLRYAIVDDVGTSWRLHLFMLDQLKRYQDAQSDPMRFGAPGL